MQDPHYPRYQNHQDSGYQDYQQGYYPDEQAEPRLIQPWNVCAAK